MNFIGGLRCHVMPWRRSGGHATGGPSFRFIGSGGETTLLPFSRFPEGTLPSDQYRSSRSFSFSRPPLFFSSFTILSLSLLGHFQYLSKFSKPAMNKLFPDFEYLSVLRGNGTTIGGIGCKKEENEKKRERERENERMISI